MNLLNSFLNKKNFWLNENNWIIKSEDDKYIELKKGLLETIIITKNINHLSLKIIEDIDCLACILNTHSINSTVLINKIRKSTLIKNMDCIIHILKIGVQDDTICLFLLNKVKHLNNNKEFAYTILTTKDEYVYFKFYKKLLKNEDFVLTLFKNKKFNNPFALIGLPNNKKISEILLSRDSYPTNQTEKLKIKYNQEILHDIKTVNKILRKPMGHVLYSQLSTEIKKNKDVCLTMMKYHPEHNTLNESIKTLSNFKKCSRFWIYYNDFVSQMNYFGSMFENEDNLLEALKCLKPFKRMSRLSLGTTTSSFIQHSMVNFIKSSSNPLLKTFLTTEKGRYLLEISSLNKTEIKEIDSWIHEELLFVLEKIKLYNKMNEFPLFRKENKQKSVKI